MASASATMTIIPSKFQNIEVKKVISFSVLYLLLFKIIITHKTIKLLLILYFILFFVVVFSEELRKLHSLPSKCAQEC